MAYYPGARAQTILWNYLDPPDVRPDVIDVRRRGYQNALRFHRMLIDAGGRVLVGTDGGNFSLPGLGVHHEMQVFAEDMRLTPMQIIQAATRWPAETMRAQDRFGTIAAGKLADLLIVDADPLRDIKNLQTISAVVANGSLQDGKYHSSYWNPFQGDGPITLPVVDDIGWAVNVRRQAPGRGGAPPGPDGGRGVAPPPLPPLPPGFGNARQPQPTIETIDSGRRDYADPDFSKVVVKEGGPTLTLTLTDSTISNAHRYISTTFPSQPPSRIAWNLRRRSMRPSCARQVGIKSSFGILASPILQILNSATACRIGPG